MKLIDIKKDYFAYLSAEKNASQLTINTYESDFTQFRTFLIVTNLSENIKDISTQVLRNYFSHIKITKNYSSSTIRRKIHSMSTFFKYLTESEYIEKNPMAPIHAPKEKQKLKIYFQNTEIAKLIDSPIKNKVKNPIRDKAIMMTLFYTGLRRSELISLKIDDVDLSSNIMIVKKAKGQKQRLIPLVEELSDILWLYLKSRLPIENNMLFVNDHGNKLSTTWIQKFFERYLKLEGMDNKGYSIHKCRHSFATHLVRNETSIFAIQELLGHADLNSTKVYTHLDEKFIRKEIEKIPRFTHK